MLFSLLFFVFCVLSLSSYYSTFILHFAFWFCRRFFFSCLLRIHSFDYLTENSIEIQRDLCFWEKRKKEITFAIMIRSQLGNILFVYWNVVLTFFFLAVLLSIVRVFVCSFKSVYISCGDFMYLACDCNLNLAWISKQPKWINLNKTETRRIRIIHSHFNEYNIVNHLLKLFYFFIQTNFGL